MPTVPTDQDGNFNHQWQERSWSASDLTGVKSSSLPTGQGVTQVMLVSNIYGSGCLTLLRQHPRSANS